MADPSVQCIWKQPSELRNAPDSLVKPLQNLSSIGRYTRYKTACRTRVSAQVQEDPSRMSLVPKRIRVCRKQKYATSKNQQAAAGETDNIQVLRLPDKRLAVVPFSPQLYCKELVDDENELLVVELQAACHTERAAWLDDEKLSAVLVNTQTGTYIVSRLDLQTFVKTVVLIAKPIRNLEKALYKMCSPLGTDGPTVTLLPSSRVLREMKHSLLEESQHAGENIGLDSPD
uniref:Uncharacterized protein n=1 Tax=viral metagenome TaxID=1070528 RepID=A0A6C0C037_9ZZZZ